MKFLIDQQLILLNFAKVNTIRFGMPNKHIQEVIENQTKQLNIACQECINKYGESVSLKFQKPYYNDTSKNLMCFPFWDEILCWPYTFAGKLAELPCPEYIAGFQRDQFATRQCTSDGTWYINELTGEPWANYSACVNDGEVTIYIHPKLNNISDTSEVIVHAVKIISQTGYAFSLVTLLIAFLIMLLIRRLHCSRNILHMNLFASFILRGLMYYIKDFLFIHDIGLPGDFSERNGELYFKTDNIYNNYGCKLITTLVHYFAAANFSWILMESLYLNSLIFRAPFSDTGKGLFNYICFGWGLPIIIIAPWVIARIHLDDVFCWTTNDNLYAFFIIAVPILISIVINFIIYIKISIVLFTKLRSPVQENARRYLKWAKSTLVLVPLFGVHYTIFLIFYFVGETEIWLVCDTLFTSFQGFFVAVLFCFVNNEVRTELKPYFLQFFTCLAKHRIFGKCFPCKEKFFSITKDRQSVYTTTSFTSIVTNGVGNRSHKIKIDGSQRKRSSGTGDTVLERPMKLSIGNSSSRQTETQLTPLSYKETSFIENHRKRRDTNSTYVEEESRLIGGSEVPIINDF